MGLTCLFCFYACSLVVSVDRRSLTLHRDP